MSSRFFGCNLQSAIAGACSLLPFSYDGFIYLSVFPSSPLYSLCDLQEIAASHHASSPQASK